MGDSACPVLGMPSSVHTVQVHQQRKSYKIESTPQTVRGARFEEIEVRLADLDEVGRQPEEHGAHRLHTFG